MDSAEDNRADIEEAPKAPVLVREPAPEPEPLVIKKAGRPKGSKNKSVSYTHLRAHET